MTDSTHARASSSLGSPVDGLAVPRKVGVTTADPGRSEMVRHLVSGTQLAILIVQLGLLALVIRQFEIESPAFYELTLLTVAGFVVHSLLPLPYRLPFFTVLSLAAIGLVLGLRAGVPLVALGLVLIGMCHVPVSFRLRVAALVVVGVGLAVLRADWIRAPWSAAVWPILGSMFMFRLCAYLYDLKHDKERPNIARTLSYFFLLPNVCFPLFPVIDFKTFRRTYYDVQAFEIYHRGVRWIFRGIVHLVLYRFVYYHLTLTPAEVVDVPDLVQYLTSNFLLYLRVSGQFHVIVGMLHLFGFNLPPTHYFFYLASSFNDFWRRINIYWKDFMMKLFYYPAYFSLRRFGGTVALIVSTLFVFLATWVLHSYQWFWLRGTFPLIWQDGVFWGVLAVLVIANSLYEARHGRTRTLGRRAWTFGSLAGVTLRTAGTFCVICVLWSLWTSGSFSEWLALWSLPGGWGLADARGLMPAVLLGSLWLGLRADMAPTDPPAPGGGSTFGRLKRSAPATILSILLMYIVGQPAVHSRLGAAGELVESTRSARLNAHDASQLEIGYYEGLLRVDRFNSQLWEVYARNAGEVDEWTESRPYQMRNDFLLKDMRPNLRREFAGHQFSTNAAGMRDRDYEKVPAAGTRRIALMGSSVLMGWGVADDQTFEELVESRLNREQAATAVRHEVLNFGVGGYGPLEQLADFEGRVLAFQPNAIVYIAHHSEEDRAVRHLLSAVSRGVEIPYDDLRQILRTAKVDARTAETVARRRLEARTGELVSFAYRRIVAACRAKGITPIWVFLPALEREQPHELHKIAQDAGFHVIDLADVYAGHDRKSLRVSEADAHPNTAGHKLIAEGLYRELMELDQRASLGLLQSPSSKR